MVETWWQDLKAALARRLWRPEAEAESRWKKGLLRGLQIAHGVLQDLSRGQLTLQAMSLVYTTLIALVPLLAVSFSVLKAFGVHNQAEPLLARFLRPLGPKGVELTRQIIEFVDDMQVGLLGSVGVALLLYSVISLIQKIEEAFNSTWHIKRTRKLTQRFSEYLSVILVGPVLIFAALGLTASVMGTEVVGRLLAIQPLGSAVRFGGQLLPYLLVIAAFTFIYVFVPNTRVRLGSALTGALLAGVAWQTIGWAFTSFVVSSARYAGFYSGFAILLMFMIWLYLSWLILLLGASVAFYHQHPEFLGLERRQLELSGRLREKLALLAMVMVARRHFDGGPAWATDDMAKHLNLPPDVLSGVLDDLEGAGLLAPSGADEAGYLPARALERISLEAIRAAVRRAGESSLLSPERLPSDPQVDGLDEAVESAVGSALAGRSLRDLVAGEE